MILRRFAGLIALAAVVGLLAGVGTGYAYRRRAGGLRGWWLFTPGPGVGLPSPGEGLLDESPGLEPGTEPGTPTPGSPEDQKQEEPGPLGPPVRVVDQLDPVRPGGTTKAVALTFDAGWIYETTPDLLRVLDEEKVKATFFLRAKWVADHQDLARAIVSHGHLVEDHSFSHQDMKKLDPAAREAELERSIEVFQRVLGIRPRLFRPPYGSYDQALLSQLGQRGYRAAVMWSIDSLDWQEPGAERVARKVLGGARDGAIVLMHVGSHDGVKALPTIIETLREDGYSFVRLDDLAAGAVQ